MTEIIKPYERLAGAIILQAVKDYRAAVRKYNCDPKAINAKSAIYDCARFFHSDWFTALTGVDGRRLEVQLLEDMNRPKKRRRRKRARA